MKNRFLSLSALILAAVLAFGGCASSADPGKESRTDAAESIQPKESQTTAQTEPETDPETESETEANMKIPTGTKGQNPIISTLFTADPSAHVFGDRLYIYASHDVFPSRGCDLMDKYHVFSTTNMVDFEDEGEILSSADLSWGAEGFMWAPDCAQKDGKYYFYFPHPDDTENWNSTWRCGVAVSDSPAGGFRDAGRLKNSAGGFVGQADGTGNDYGSMIDPCVFQDTDGSYYLFIGGGARLYYAKLADDMLSLAEPLKRVPDEQCPDYHEGSWVFKRGDTYYLMYADNEPGGNCMRYSTAKSVNGPWTYGGVFLSPVRDCDTTHGSICEFKGQWYLFYHNAALSGNGTLRSVCIDKIEFAPDGSILPVVQTEEGVDAVGERVLVSPSKGCIASITDEAALSLYTDVKTYRASSFDYGGGCNFNGTAIENLHLQGSWFEVNGVNGGNGGRALVTVYYATQDTCATALVHSTGDKSGDGYFLAMRGNGSWSDYTAKATLLVDLNPGSDNSIRFTCGMFGVNVAKVTVAVIPAKS